MTRATCSCSSPTSVISGASCASPVAVPGDISSVPGVGYRLTSEESERLRVIESADQTAGGSGESRTAEPGTGCGRVTRSHHLPHGRGGPTSRPKGHWSGDWRGLHTLPEQLRRKGEVAGSGDALWITAGASQRSRVAPLRGSSPLYAFATASVLSCFAGPP